MTRVEVVIDELVVRGLTPEAARTAAAAFEERLAELAATGVVPRRAEPFRMLPPVTATGHAVGGVVAEALWSSLAGAEG